MTVTPRFSASTHKSQSRVRACPTGIKTVDSPAAAAARIFFGSSAYPAEVTAQMVANFVAGGAAINVRLERYASDSGYQSHRDASACAGAPDQVGGRNLLKGHTPRPGVLREDSAGGEDGRDLEPAPVVHDRPPGRAARQHPVGRQLLRRRIAR